MALELAKRGRARAVVGVAERFLAEMPDAELRELTGCGHTAMFDDPELVASEILRFTSTSS